MNDADALGPRLATLPPVTTPEQLEHRWRLVLEAADPARPELWVLWFDADHRQLSVVVPVEGVDRRPDDAFCTSLLDVVAGVLRDAAPSGWAAMGFSRPGTARPDENDRMWARALYRAARERDVALAPLHVLCRDTVVPLRPDDLVEAGSRSA